MSNLHNFVLLKKFFYLLKKKKLFFLLIPLVLFSSLLDLFGLATIGVLINYIINKGSNECRVPITIVPGNLSDEQIDALI